MFVQLETHQLSHKINVIDLQFIPILGMKLQTNVLDVNHLVKITTIPQLIQTLPILVQILMIMDISWVSLSH